MEKDIEILYGINPILEFVRSEKGRGDIKRILISKHRAEDKSVKEIVSLSKKGGIKVEWLSSDDIDRLCKNTKHQGIAAFLNKKKLLTLDELLSQVEKKEGKYPVIVVADGIEDPGNLGAIIRSAEGFGMDGLVIPERRACGITPTVSKTSAGATAHLPIAVVTNTANALEQLRAKGYWIVALDEDGEMKCFDSDLLRPMALVIGGESCGIRDIIRKRADIVISIPMHGMVSSLNASAASAVIFYEIIRQREKSNNGKKTLPD